MLQITATFDLTILYFVAANIVAILLYVLLTRRRTRTVRENIARLEAVVTEFFRQSEEQVVIKCMAAPGGKSYIALIDSLPSKRFRYSHVVAVILANHVRKTCGLELDRIYWRFPIKAVREESEEQRQAAEALGFGTHMDTYYDIGLQRMKNLPQYEVTEASWDKFEALMQNRVPPARSGSTLSESDKPAQQSQNHA